LNPRERCGTIASVTEPADALRRLIYGSALSLVEAVPA